MTTIDIEGAIPKVMQNKSRIKPQSSQSQIIPSTLALICGGCAGTTVDICLFPIDTLKTRIQSSQGFWKAGGFNNIYKGISAAAVGSAPGAALFFVSYETFKPLIHNRVLHSTKELNNNPMTHMLAAGCGEIAACLVRVPTEIVKQRMQTGEHNHFSQAIKHIWHSYKFGGFYVGYSTTVFREIPFSFIQFPIWERLKLTLANNQYDGNTNLVKPWQGALCGSFAGAFSAAVTTPLDVMKTRLMLRYDANGVPYNGLVDCAKRVYTDEGSSVFLRGIGPRTTWIFIGGFCFFGAYEKSKSILKPYWGIESET